MAEPVKRSVSEGFVPAAGRSAFTRLYDPVMRVTMRESAWRAAAVDRLAAELEPGDLVADVGAGTGSATAMLSARAPAARVLAIDADPEIIEIGRGKASGKNVTWRRAPVDDLGLDPGSVKAVLVSLLLHHLDHEGKVAGLDEIHRALEPGGLLVVADWGRPDRWTTVPFLALRALDGFGNTADHAAGKIPELIRDAGFEDVETFKAVNTVWGRLELIAARRPVTG